ncbi:MAG: MFS transporter [Planctomycetota bacterium]
MTTPTEKIAPRNYAWGVGGVADNLLTFGLAWTIFPIFNIGYGVDAFWLGVAIFLPRLIDVITDPIMGMISDRTRSRFGRRRPYIFLGTILMAVLFALLWLPPFEAVATGDVAAASVATAEASGGSGWSIPPLPTGDELALLVWVGVIYTLITLSYTVFSVPYIALGYEFTRNYDTMTRVMASRLYFTTLASFGVAGLYRLSVDEGLFGGDETLGMRYVGVGVAVLVVLTGIVPAIACREERQVERPKVKASMREIASVTLGNRSFLMVMAAMLIFVISLYTTGVMGTHINVFYVAQGDKEKGAEYVGWVGVIIALCTLVGMYPMTRISQMLSKRSVLLFAFGLIITGYASFWFTWNQDTPRLQYISAAIVGLGSSGIWLMLDSMIGDVTKDDEARNGVQREGLYGAAKSFMFKLAVAVTSISGAFTLSVSGFEEGVDPSEEVQLNLRFLYIIVQCTGTALAMVAIWFFPISRARAEENERLIDARKQRG